jgi:hypothetical protein
MSILHYEKKMLYAPLCACTQPNPRTYRNASLNPSTQTEVAARRLLPSLVAKKLPQRYLTRSSHRLRPALHHTQK